MSPLGVSLLAVLLLGEAVPAPASAPVDLASLAELIGERAESLGEQARDERVAVLLARGPALLPELHALLASAGGRPSPAGREPLTRLARGLGREAVVGYVHTLAGRTAEEPSVAARTAALSLLGPVAQGEDLGLALSVTGASSDAPLDSGLRLPLHELAVEVLGRDPDAHYGVMQHVSFLDATAASPLVRAVGRAAGEDGWETLGALLGEDLQLDRATLSAIAEMARRLPGTAPDTLGRRVGAYLHDQDVMLVRNALAALGALDDQQHLGDLIELLDHEDPAARSDAHGALVAVTGLALTADAERWRHWVASEEAWWRLEAPALFGEIAGGELTEARAALATLSRHRLRRDAIAARILGLVGRESPPLREDACRALATLGAKVAAPALRDLADDIAEEDRLHGVVDSALEALGASHGCRTPEPRTDAPPGTVRDARRED